MPSVSRAGPNKPDIHLSRAGLAPGQIIYCVVFVDLVLNRLAHEVSKEGSIPISLPDIWHPPKDPTARPCIFVRYDADGFCVIPLATFNGTPPDTWDDLLREIVLPIGAPDAILDTFRDRKSYDTTPSWTHNPGSPTYIVPRIVHLPRGKRIQIKRRHIPMHEFAMLDRHCRGTTQRLLDLGKERLTELLQSYLDVLRKRPDHPLGEECSPDPTDAVSIFSAGAKSSLNPSAASFVSQLSFVPSTSDSNLPPAELFDMISKRLLSGDRANTHSLVPSGSLDQVLQEKANPVLAPTAPAQKSATTSNTDKENRPT